MLILIPCSLSDIHLVPPLVETMVKFGQLDNHEILVVPSLEVTEKATECSVPLHNLCKTRVQSIGFNPLGGWPLGPNQHFVAMLNMLGYNKETFLILEPDCTPISPGWADALQAEMLRSGKPFNGFVRASSEVHPELDAYHMVGAGMYHADFVRENQMWQYANTREHEPWDIFLRHLIGPRANHSQLLWHAPRSHSYIRTATGYQYTLPVFDFTGKVVRNETRNVPTQCVLVHGCKDASLAKLILDPKPEQVPDLAVTGEWAPTNHPFSPIADPAKVSELGEPSTKMAKSPEFLALLSAIQHWQIEIPSRYTGLAPGSKYHAKLILDALESAKKQEATETTLTNSDFDNAKRIARIVNSNPTGKAMKRRLILDELEISLAELLSAAKVPGAEFKLSDGPALYVVPLKPRSVTPREISVMPTH